MDFVVPPFAERSPLTLVNCQAFLEAFGEMCHIFEGESGNYGPGRAPPRRLRAPPRRIRTGYVKANSERPPGRVDDGA